MNGNVMPSVVRIEADELKQLVNEVRETVATGLILVNKKRKATPGFGIVDLWNIRRGMKSATFSRRYLR